MDPLHMIHTFFSPVDWKYSSANVTLKLAFSSPHRMDRLSSVLDLCIIDVLVSTLESTLFVGYTSVARDSTYVHLVFGRMGRGPKRTLH